MIGHFYEHEMDLRTPEAWGEISAAISEGEPTLDFVQYPDRFFSKLPELPECDDPHQRLLIYQLAELKLQRQAKLSHVDSAILGRQVITRHLIGETRNELKDSLDLSPQQAYDFLNGNAIVPFATKYVGQATLQRLIADPSSFQEVYEEIQPYGSVKSFVRRVLGYEGLEPELQDQLDDDPAIGIAAVRQAANVLRALDNNDREVTCSRVEQRLDGNHALQIATTDGVAISRIRSSFEKFVEFADEVFGEDIIAMIGDTVDVNEFAASMRERRLDRFDLKPNEIVQVWVSHLETANNGLEAAFTKLDKEKQLEFGTVLIELRRRIGTLYNITSTDRVERSANLATAALAGESIRTLTAEFESSRKGIQRYLAAHFSEYLIDHLPEDTITKLLRREVSIDSEIAALSGQKFEDERDKMIESRAGSVFKGLKKEGFSTTIATARTPSEQEHIVRALCDGFGLFVRTTNVRKDVTPVAVQLEKLLDPYFNGATEDQLAVLAGTPHTLSSTLFPRLSTTHAQERGVEIQDTGFT